MRSRKGFTLIELMVVVLIVAILAGVAIPIIRGRLGTARWSEGKAMMGSIATVLRCYAVERGSSPDGNWPPTLAGLGLLAGDLTGTYFTLTEACWASASYPDGGDLTFTISVDAPAGIDTPSNVTLDQAGRWVETP
jgi:type IV pilus assembly protein PilA